MTTPDPGSNGKADTAERMLIDGLAMLQQANDLVDPHETARPALLAGLASASFLGGLLILNLEAARGAIRAREQARAQLSELKDALASLAPGGDTELLDRVARMPGMDLYQATTHSAADPQ